MLLQKKTKKFLFFLWKKIETEKFKIRFTIEAHIFSLSTLILLLNPLGKKWLHRFFSILSSSFFLFVFFVSQEKRNESIFVCSEWTTLVCLCVCVCAWVCVCVHVCAERTKNLNFVQKICIYFISKFHEKKILRGKIFCLRTEIMGWKQRNLPREWFFNIETNFLSLCTRKFVEVIS